MAAQGAGGQGQALTLEQQAIVALQNELGQVRTQVTTVTQAYDALKTAHETLNQAAANAIREKATEIAAAEERLMGMIFRQQFDLLDAKDLKPDEFRGRKTENFKP